MTHDEMIEAVAKAIGQRIEGAAEDMDSDWYGRPLWQAYVEEARAAIRVIAPAVLEDVAALMEGKGGVIPLGSYYARLVSGNSMPHPSGDDRNRIKYDFQRKEFDRVTENVAHAIRAMKTRYEQ